jgi:hypothetical protein
VMNNRESKLPVRDHTTNSTVPLVLIIPGSVANAFTYVTPAYLSSPKCRSSHAVPTRMQVRNCMYQCRSEWLTASDFEETSLVKNCTP